MSPGRGSVRSGAEKFRLATEVEAICGLRLGFDYGRADGPLAPSLATSPVMYAMSERCTPTYYKYFYGTVPRGTEWRMSHVAHTRRARYKRALLVRSSDG